MESEVTFLDCPAYLGGDRAARCGLPAEIEARYSAGSTDGPLDSVRIRCPRGHWFNGHIESLTTPGQSPGRVYQRDSSRPLYQEGTRGRTGCAISRADQAQGRG
jgi:hypothetical protein